MAKPREIIEDIVKDLTTLQTTPSPIAPRNGASELPSMISAGNGQSIVVSLEIEQNISLVADLLLKSNSAWPTQYTQAEWRALVRGAFGPALAQIDLNDSAASNADAVLAAVRKTVTHEATSPVPREVAFGCTLFGNNEVQPFKIGPIRFEAKSDWVVRKHQEGSISSVARQRLERALAGDRLRKRQDSYDYNVESEMLHMMSDSPYICSVAINGLGQEAGRGKALTAARLGTAGIALLWHTPSKALEGINIRFDRRPQTRTVLTFIPGYGIQSKSGWSHMPHGPWLPRGEWEQLFLQRQNHFQVIAEILEYVVSPSGAVGRPKMMNTLTQALLWFHEGCRETVSLMAIVKFATTLDALACGGKAGGIRRLINARLGIQDTDPIRQDGPSLKQAIEEVYAYGRSRTLHGSNEKLGHDWMGTRALAEQLARLCLIQCIEWLAQNPSCDIPQALSK